MNKFLPLTLCLLLTLTVMAQDKPARVPFDPLANPAQDLAAAVTKASIESKRVLLDVGGEWCIWCHRMDEFIEANAEIKAYLEKHYVVVKVNYSKENKNEAFLGKYPKVAGYPHIFILDKKGKFLHSQNTGDLEKDKSYDKKKYIAFLKKWSK